MTQPSLDRLREIQSLVVSRSQDLNTRRVGLQRIDADLRHTAREIGELLAEAKSLAGRQWSAWRSQLPEDLVRREAKLRKAATGQLNERQLHLALDLAPPAPPPRPRVGNPAAALDRAISATTADAAELAKTPSRAWLTRYTRLYAHLYVAFGGRRPAEVADWLLEGGGVAGPPEGGASRR